MREMGVFKPSLLLLWLLVVASASEVAQLVESRTLPGFPSQQPGYSKILATLGVVCKCCDGGGGECTVTWEGSCSKLQCLPWKLG